MPIKNMQYFYEKNDLKKRKVATLKLKKRKGVIK